MKRSRRFVCYFWFMGWDCLSLGFHISFGNPNVEVHLPFGFIRVGWIKDFTLKEAQRCRGFGYQGQVLEHQRPMCGGSFRLGTACGVCEQCQDELDRLRQRFEEWYSGC